MNVAELKSELSHPSFAAVGGTIAAYALIIFVMTLVLFAIPYLVFLLF